MSDVDTLPKAETTQPEITEVSPAPAPAPTITKPPVILQILPELRAGGVERGTIEVAGAIARSGWKSLVASSGGPMIPSVNYVKAEHITLPLKSKNPIQMYKNIALLERVIRERGVDIVHARSRACAWSAYYAAKRCGVPFITTFHGIYGLQNSFKRKYNSIMTRGERVIAISDFCARHIMDNYPIDIHNIRIIHRGVDVKLFDPENVKPSRMAEIALQWRVPEELPVILCPGRITRWKGQDVLIKALAKLPHRNFFCLMIGEDSGHPEYRNELEDLVIKSGLSGHVRLVGHTPFMPEVYTMGLFVVVPSSEPEAFGRVPIEAQAMGKLVIATNHGGPVETVLPGQTGMLVEPGNVDALSAALDEMLHLPPKNAARASNSPTSMPVPISPRRTCATRR